MREMLTDIINFGSSDNSKLAIHTPSRLAKAYSVIEKSTFENLPLFIIVDGSKDVENHSLVDRSSNISIGDNTAMNESYGYLEYEWAPISSLQIQSN